MDPGREIDVVDDDEVSRELISLFVEQAGFVAHASESGDAELARLRENSGKPMAILADLRMPGTSGVALASALRELCGQACVLIAMSATAPSADSTIGYDGFLQKPFGAGQLETLLAQLAARPDDVSGALNQRAYASLAQSMPAQQLRELYELCLNDSIRRAGRMRDAVEQGDFPEFHRGAHAIKGGCGMIGAADLARRATGFEHQTSFTGGELGALDEFLSAVEHLRRMLDRNSAPTPGVVIP